MATIFGKTEDENAYGRWRRAVRANHAAKGLDPITGLVVDGVRQYPTKAPVSAEPTQGNEASQYNAETLKICLVIGALGVGASIGLCATWILSDIASR